MKSYFIIWLMFASFCVNAEVFKCQASTGKTVYQPEPCGRAAKQKVIEIKEMTPEETEQAKEKLKIWQDRQSAEEAAKLAAEQERQKQLQEQAQQGQQRMREQQSRLPPPPTGINRRFGYLPQ